MSWRVALVIAVTVTMVGAPRADDAADEAAFTAAAAMLARGDEAGARAAFVELAARAPTGRWADDALAEAAELAERAGDWAAARQAWRTIVRDHGDGRLARRAQARLAALTAAGGDDGRWDAVAAEHDRLVRAAAAGGDPRDTLATLGALLDREPGYPRRFVAAQWLAEAWARRGDHAAARAWIAKAVAAAPGLRERFRAELVAARLAADRGEVDAALALVRGLETSDATLALARDELRSELEWRRTRARLRGWAAAALAVIAIGAVVTMRRQRGSWRGAARALWPPPLEVLYLAPVVAVIGGVAHTGNMVAARAVVELGVGGVAVAWLAGAVARGWTRPRWPLALGFVTAALIAVLAVAYRAVSDEQLLDLLIETWRSGHDAR